MSTGRTDLSTKLLPDPDVLTVEWHERRLLRADLPLDEAAIAFGLWNLSRTEPNVVLRPSFVMERAMPLLVHFVRQWPADSIHLIKQIRPSVVREPDDGAVTYELFRINGYAPHRAS